MVQSSAHLLRIPGEKNHQGLHAKRSGKLTFHNPAAPLLSVLSVDFSLQAHGSTQAIFFVLQFFYDKLGVVLTCLVLPSCHWFPSPGTLIHVM